MIKCKSADRYKARRAPQCNNGDPCDVCSYKWETAQRLKSLEERISRLEAEISPHVLAGYVDQ